MLSKQVYEEIRKVPFLKSRIDSLIKSNDFVICQLIVGTQEAELYMKLTEHPDAGYKIIGHGEASAIALTKFRGGILGSNNLRDIRPYIELYHLKYITTGDILIEALNQSIINEGQGNSIWREILDRQRLPADTFSKYLASK